MFNKTLRQMIRISNRIIPEKTTQPLGRWNLNNDKAKSIDQANYDNCYLSLIHTYPEKYQIKKE